MDVDVALAAVRRRGPSWVVTWRLVNRGHAPATVVEAWHPHGRFRSSRRRRAVRLAPGRPAQLELPARIHAAPGETVENCFLILRVRSGRERWRVLARFTLRLGRDGVPRLRVEAVDAHPAGR